MRDEQYLRRCLELAVKAKGRTSPNPMVGAVLVYGDRIIGAGAHECHGGSHAEVACLASVPLKDRPLIPESRLYVNLEPCAHTGKTPPCAPLIIKNGIRQVIVCNKDPFPGVCGRGFALLKKHQIKVRHGLLANEGRWLNRRFFHFHLRKRPYVILKWAQSVQGFFAPEPAARFQLTNGLSQKLVHKWRTEEDAILVGTKTVLVDNPHLTARFWTGKQPLRIILDRELCVPEKHKVRDASARTWIINEHRTEHVGSMDYKKFPFNPDLLLALMQELYREGILSVIVEGGARLLNSFIQQDLWDEARIFQGGSLPNGIPAPTLSHGQKVWETTLTNDRLAVFLHQQNPFSYIPQMEL